MRRLIKQQYGNGWSVIEVSGKTRLTRTYEDKTRSTITLDIPWEPNKATAIQNSIGVLKQRMEEHSISLKEAHARSQHVAGVVAGVGVQAGAVDWNKVAESFMATRSGHRATTIRDTQGRINKAIALFNQQSKPSDGPELMKAYASTHFKHCPAGGQGRKRGLGDVAAFLIYAVEKCGADGRWMPLTGDDLDALIGTSDNREGNTATTPIKPDQLIGLLDHLLEEGKSDLWLAVALVGLYGLRPAELGALSVEDGRLYVGSQVKRNRRTMKRDPIDQLVMALEIDGRDDGARALRQYESGLIKLPQGIRTAIEGGEFKPIGDAFRQYLDRLPYWKSLVKANKGLTPYSLRHGWAWRAHKHYSRPLSVRDASALMRHNPTTHMKHYGRWTNEQDLIDAITSLNAQPASRETQMV